MAIKKVVTYVNKDGFSFEFEPIENTLKIKETETGFEVRYLTYDECVDNPFETSDGNGNFYHWKDYGKEQLSKYCELLGYDEETREQIRPSHPLAVAIDKYEHSGVAYSLHGEGMQCRWDTSSIWAIWYPDDCVMDDIKRFKTKKAQRKRAIELARQACELFNQWANGETYIIVKETYDKNKKQIETENCGGYFGQEYALKELETAI
jgi:hypothetical protein